MTHACVWSQVEEELKAQIEMWEQKHLTAFVVHGQKFMEYVTEQREMHRLEKERAKQERVREPSLGRGKGGHVSSPDLLSPWDVSLLLLPVTQQLKNKKQTETEMLYGSTSRPPNKQ